MSREFEEKEEEEKEEREREEEEEEEEEEFVVFEQKKRVCGVVGPTLERQTDGMIRPKTLSWSKNKTLHNPSYLVTGMDSLNLYMN